MLPELQPYQHMRLLVTMAAFDKHVCAVQVSNVHTAERVGENRAARPCCHIYKPVTAATAVWTYAGMVLLLPMHDPATAPQVPAVVHVVL